jgi:hypothetical protein
MPSGALEATPTKSAGKRIPEPIPVAMRKTTYQGWKPEGNRRVISV